MASGTEPALQSAALGSRDMAHISVFFGVGLFSFFKIYVFIRPLPAVAPLVAEHGV